MDIRRVVLGWLLYVAATVLVYWVSSTPGSPAAGDALAVAVEIIVGAPSLPMMIPIATVTYCMCVVGIYWRYYRRRESEATG